MRLLLLFVVGCGGSGQPQGAPSGGAAPAAAVAGGATAGGASGSVPAPDAHHLAITPIDVPTGAEQRLVRAASAGTLDGAPFTFGFQPIARTGDTIGGAVFGARTTRSGTPIAAACEGLDYTGMWQASTGLRMVTHFECHPGAVYVTELAPQPDGRLVATATAPVDLGPVDAGYYYCAGAPSRWDSHLAAQEYEADVRKLRADGTVSDDYEGYNAMATWWDGSLQGTHPWLYGWVVEVPAEGAAARRWAMGRFSHEIALPMPDDRTVYMSDDTGKSGALFLFQADRPRDLTSGTLWAARWSATPDPDVYALRWVSLGHATDAEVERVAREQPAFEEIFDVAEPTGDTCPDGLVYTRTTFGAECLRIRPGMEAAATRLESRRAAAVLGATTELTKAEGLALAEEERTLWLAMSRFAGGSTAGTWTPGRDDLKLAPNRCGGVWRLALGETPTEGPEGPWVATTATLALQGVEEGEGCAPDAIANPDNVEWIAGAGTLAIAEDTPHHANNALWLHDPARGTLARALTAPLGAEVSGLRWTPDVAGRSYLSVSIQGPLGGVPGATPEERRSIAGVLGPFPAWE